MNRQSIGVVTTVHTYTHFVERWARSVRALNTTPDMVVIAATDPYAVLQVADVGGIDLAVVKVPEPFGLGKYLNAAVDAASGMDWIAWIGVDDTYRPHALDGLPFTEADVAAFGLQFELGMVWQPRPVEPWEVLQVAENPVPCGSPFRRSLWERIPFQPDLAPFEDWAFWVGAAHLGARFASTGRIDVDYAQHADQIVPPTEPTRTHIAEWAADLRQETQ